MNKTQEGLIELVGQKYTKWFYANAVPSVSGKPILNGEGILTRGEFINKIKTDPEFAKHWGLKIEERELSLEERVDYKKKRDGIARTFAPYTHQMLDGSNIPTKLITITYNNETVESHENNS
jgi:hypothetical protein